MSIEESETPSETVLGAHARTEKDWQRVQDALDNERARRRSADRRARRGDEARARVEKLRRENSEQIEVARLEGRRVGAAAVLGEVSQRLVRSEARALAHEAGFRNPLLVLRLLDLDGVRVSEDCEVDTAAISEQLDELARNWPYLLVEVC